MRLFVAAELPADVRDALVAWRPRDPALRPVPPDSLHVTLAFLGEREASDAVAVAGVVRAVARPVTALALGRVRWLPRPAAPRVLAVELEDGDGALGAMRADLVAGLVETIAFVPEERPFLPHVTVARVRRQPRGRPQAMVEAPPEAAAPFAAEALTLMRSRLSPGGARYEPLERVAL